MSFDYSGDAQGALEFDDVQGPVGPDQWDVEFLAVDQATSCGRIDEAPTEDPGVMLEEFLESFFSCRRVVDELAELGKGVRALFEFGGFEDRLSVRILGESFDFFRGHGDSLRCFSGIFDVDSFGQNAL